MEYFGIIPERKLWVKVAAIILALYTIYHALINNMWFYLPLGVILILATFSKRIQVVSEKGVDGIYILLGYKFHNLWTWDEILAVHKDSYKSMPNIELHFSKGVINRRFIFSRRDVEEITSLLKEIKPDIKVMEVNHKR